MTDFKYKTYRELQEDVANMQSSNTTITPEQVESLRRYRENIERDTSPIPSFYYMREGAEKSPLYYTNKPFGSSQYDPKNISLEDLTTMYENPNELRAMAQPWYDQLANGAAKAVLTAANTFVSGTAGLIWGLGSAVTHWDFARLWDNSVTNASQGFSDWMEENLANYKTKEEQETPFNFGSMNFWADTILKNVGFAVGAFYSGKLFTGALGVLANGASGIASKLGAGYNAQKAIMQGTQKAAPWVHAITSAVGEGSIEAINNSRDKFRLAKQQLDDQFHQMQQEVMEKYGDSLEGFAELEKLGKAYDESLKTLEQERIAMGNMDLLWNIPILTFSNWIQFGKYIGRGFQTAKKNVKVKGDWGNYRAAMTNRKAKLKAATVGFSEGMEEWAQKVASDWAGFYTGDRATDNIISNFQNAGYNYQATVEHYGWMDSLAKSLSTNFVDPQAWEEFFVGALYGITGIPIIGKSKKGSGYSLQFAGGSLAEYNEAKKEQATQQYYADYMNRVAKKFAEEKASDKRTKNYWVNIIAHNALEKQKEAAALNDDAKGFKDAEFQEALRDIIMFDTTGNLNTLKEQIKEMADMSDEEIANLIETTTDKKTAEQQRKEDIEKTLILSKQLDTLEKNNQFIESQLLAIQDKIDETYEEPQTKAVKKKRKNLIRQKNELTKKYGITEDADAIIERARGVTIDLESGYYIPVNSAIATEYDEIQAEIDKLNTTINNNEYKDIVTGPFVQTNGGEKMTVEEARTALKQKLDNNAANIDLYIKANNELQLDLGPNLSQDEADLMIYLKAQQYNWAKRAKELFKEIHNTLNGLGGDTLLQEKAKIQNKMAELESAEKKKSKEYEDAKKALMFIDVAEQALTALLTEDKNEDDTLFKAAAFFTNPGLLEFIDKTSNKYLDDIAQVLNTRGIELPQKIADLKKIGKGIQEFSELYKKYKENPDKLSEDVRINRERTQAAATNKAAKDLYKKLDFTNANTLAKSLEDYKEDIAKVGGVNKITPFMTDIEKSLFNSLGTRGILRDGLLNILDKADVDPAIASSIVDRTLRDLTEEKLSEKGLKAMLNDAITPDAIDALLAEDIQDELERRERANQLAEDVAEAFSKEEGTRDFGIAIGLLHNMQEAMDAKEAAARSRAKEVAEEVDTLGAEASRAMDKMEAEAEKKNKAKEEEAARTEESAESKEPKEAPKEDSKEKPKETPNSNKNNIDELHNAEYDEEAPATDSIDIYNFMKNSTVSQSGVSGKAFSYPHRPYTSEYSMIDNPETRGMIYGSVINIALHELGANLSLDSAQFKKLFTSAFPKGLYDDSVDNTKNFENAVIFAAYINAIYEYLNKYKAFDYRNSGNLLNDIKTNGTKFIITRSTELQELIETRIKEALKKEGIEYTDDTIGYLSVVPVIAMQTPSGHTQILGTYFSAMDYIMAVRSGKELPPSAKVYAEFADRSDDTPIELEITESDLRYGRALTENYSSTLSGIANGNNEADFEIVISKYDEDTGKLVFLKQNSEGKVEELTADDLNLLIRDKSIAEGAYKTGRQFIIVRSLNTGFGVPMLLTSTTIHAGTELAKETSLQIKDIVDTLIKEFTEVKDDPEKQKEVISKSLQDIKKLLGSKTADIDIGRFENNGKNFVRDFDVTDKRNKIHLKLHDIGIQIEYDNIEAIVDRLCEELKKKGKPNLTTTVSLRRMNDPKYREEVFRHTNTNLGSLYMVNEWFTFKIKENQDMDDSESDFTEEPSEPTEDSTEYTEESSSTEEPNTEEEVPSDFTDEEYGSVERASGRRSRRRRYKKVTDASTEPHEVADIDAELSWLDKVLPQMSKEGRVQLKKGLIKISETGGNAWGMFDNGIITLSDVAAIGTTYHEAFHAVFSMYLSKEEQKDLLRQAKRRYGNKDSIGLEEDMAEEFRLYIQDKLKTGFFNKLKVFFKDLGIIVNNWFRVRPSLNKYFLDISKGKFANKAIVNNSSKSKKREEEYTQEMKDILAKAPRDSQGRLLAPNGKVSNLTERQYAQVRTKAFKKWFGDWESVTIFTANNVDDIEALMKKYPSTLPNKFYHHSTNKFGKQGFDGREGTKEKLHIIGRLITDKVDVLVVENPNSSNPIAHITLATAKGVKPVESNSELQKNQDKIVPLDDFVDTTFRNNPANNTNAEAANVSKVIDENGEPLVVYHGTLTPDITIFDLAKTRSGKAFWFANKEAQKAVFYSNQDNENLIMMPLFVNMKTPLLNDDDSMESYATDETHDGGLILGKLGDFKDSFSEEEYQKLLNKGLNDNSYLATGNVKNPNQLKSATDNIGTFDPNNPDIRYREAVDVNNEKTLKEDIESFLSNFGIRINELSEFDSKEPIFNALDRVVDYTNIENLTENAGYAIAFMMQHSPEVKELIGLKRILDSPTGVKGFKRAIRKQGDYKLEYFTPFEYNRLGRDRYLKEIGKDIAEQLRKLYSGKKIDTSTNIFKKIWDIITEFFNTITPEARGKFYIIKHHTQNIANSVKLGDYTIIRKSEAKPGTNTKAELVDIGQALKDNPYEETIISTLNKYGISLAGGASIASQGTLFRPSENPLHDIDFNAAEYTQEGLENILKENFKAFKKTNEIANPSGEVTYTYLILDREFEERKDNPEVNVMTVYDKNTGERLGTRVGSELVIEKEGVKGKMLDFFTGAASREHGENVTLTFNGKQYLFSNYKNAMAFKVDIAREKDIWDYVNFMPNETGIKTLSEIKEERKNEVQTLVRRSKIIWGHPAIGKTTYLENNQDILEWDQEVGLKREAFIREQIDPSYSMDPSSAEYKKLAADYMRNGTSHPEYIEFITNEWNNLKQRAFGEGKKLFASPLILANLFREDFDLFVALPEKQFIERDTARGNYRGSSLGWKQAINDMLVELDPNKLVYTTKYFSEFMRDALGVNWGTLTDNEKSILLSEGWTKESFDNLPQSEKDAMVNKESGTIEKYSKVATVLNADKIVKQSLSKAQEEAIDRCE